MPAKTKPANEPRIRKDRGSSRVAGLLPKQLRFCQEYLVSGNATHAAIHAGYSPKSAPSTGQEILRNPIVIGFLAQKRAKQDKRMEELHVAMGLTEERVSLEVARLAFFDVRKMFNAKGDPIPVTELDDDTAAAIAGLDVLEEYEGSGPERRLVGYVKKYKIADKNSALERAAKILGMFKKDNEQPATAAANVFANFVASLSARGSRLPTGSKP